MAVSGLRSKGRGEVGRTAIGWLLLVFALGACRGPDPEVLRFVIASSPVTLDPRFATDAASARINRLVYQSLVDFDERFRPVPDLASWEQIDARRYRFTIRRDRAGRFENGDRIDSRDVKATYDAVIDASSASPHRGSLRVIDRIELVDRDTVDFVLKRPDILFPGLLVVGILPANLVEQDHPFNRRPAGSGPFDLVSWSDENRVRLRRRRDRQLVEFVRVPEPTVRVLKLLRGEIDMLQGDLPWELRAWATGQDGVRAQRSPGTRFAYVGFNLRDPVVGDARVRRAIAHAIDRNAILQNVLGHSARLASSVLVPNHWAGHPGLVPIDFDRARARALLEAAGYGASNRPRIEYKTSSDPFRLRLASILQSQLGRVGIEVELRSYDWGTFYGDIKGGRFQMYTLAWVGVKMPDIFRYTMHTDAAPPEGANRGRYRNRVVDELIEAAESATTLDEQAVLYRRVQEQLHADLPYVALWYEDNFHLARPSVSGYHLTHEGSYDGLITARKN